MSRNIIHSTDLQRDLAAQMAAIPHDKVFVLADETTAGCCVPLLDSLAEAPVITIGAGDDAKNIESLAHVWERLGQLGASRRSLLINVGGGMVTDLGGFAASTFKRGIAFINIPTTLLAQVDASVGGKTGVNFGGLKNEIGVFRDADAVIISTDFLRTLNRENMLSGYAEMLKHGVISTREHLADLLRVRLFDDVGVSSPAEDDAPSLAALLVTNVGVKQRIVAEDPLEHGIRKALNLGHTVGHAIESLLMMRRQTVLHGYAVAWGLEAELYLSAVRCGFPTATLRQVERFICDNYGPCPITCNDYEEILRLMTHDKKNHDGQTICTLMEDVGQVLINQSISEGEIREMLDFVREG